MFKITLLEERIVLDAALGAVIYVDVNAQGSNNGSSWANAYQDLQSALTEAASTATPDQIWVADGTYTPGSLRTDTFNLPDNVSLFGGFKGGEKKLEKHDPSHNLTVLNGDIGVLGVQSDNILTILTANGVKNLMNGFTVTAAFNDSTNATGGGMFLSNGSEMTLKNMVFSSNFAKGTSARFGGGGVYSTDSTLYINHSDFINNTSSRDAGAILIKHSVVDIEHSDFDNNIANAVGGALVIFSASTVNIDHSDFTNNGAIATLANQGRGGSIFIDESTVNISHSDFVNNKAVNPLQTLFGRGVGGAVAIASTALNTVVNISHSDFLNNTTDGFGGAIGSNSFGSNTLTIDHVNFENNTAAGGGAIFGRIFLATSVNDIIINHSDFTKNNASVGGGAILNLGLSKLALSHTDFDANTTAGQGGALAVARILPTEPIKPSALVTIDKVEFSKNLASGVGGAIYSDGALLMNINKSEFNRNVSNVSGGAIRIDNLAAITNVSLSTPFTVNITQSEFEKNSAPQGGAVTLRDTLNVITLNISKSEFEKNTATVQGGALYQEGGTMTVQKSEFEKNNDPLQHDIVVKLPATTNGETLPANIVNALENANHSLNDEDILVI